MIHHVQERVISLAIGGVGAAGAGLAVWQIEGTTEVVTRVGYPIATALIAFAALSYLVKLLIRYWMDKDRENAATVAKKDEIFMEWQAKYNESILKIVETHNANWLKVSTALEAQTAAMRELSHEVREKK